MMYVLDGFATSGGCVGQIPVPIEQHLRDLAVIAPRLEVDLDLLEVTFARFKVPTWAMI